MKLSYRLCWLLMALIAPSPTLSAVEGIITSETLNTNLVQAHVSHYIIFEKGGGLDGWTIDLFGVHQIGSTAKVYARARHPRSADNFFALDLVRLNSGKWFFVDAKTFLATRPSSTTSRKKGSPFTPFLHALAMAKSAVTAFYTTNSKMPSSFEVAGVRESSLLRQSSLSRTQITSVSFNRSSKTQCTIIIKGQIEGKDRSIEMHLTGTGYRSGRVDWTCKPTWSDHDFPALCRR